MSEIKKTNYHLITTVMNLSKLTAVKNSDNILL
jgi:hypothetical protein